MANDTAKTQTTNIVPVQGIFGPLPPYPCVTLIGPAGTPFFPPIDPNLDGVTITNSTIDSTVIGGSVPSSATFTNIATTTGTISAVPSGPTSIVNQAYVDAVAQGLAFKQPANYTTTGNITLSGLGTQTNGDWGSSLTAGMRILVKNQTAGAENGIYVAASGAWTRSADANTWDELVSAYLFVIAGTLYGGSAWVDTNAPGGTLGTTPVTFVQFSNNAIYTAGTGLTLTGFQFSITNTGVTANSYGGASKTLSATVNAQGQLTALSEQSIAIANTQVSGLGTMSTQNANNVAITGGTIDATTIGGSTAAAITGTTITANTQFSGSGAGLTGTASGLSIGGNAATATSATTATNLAGGSAGALPYQSGAGATTFLNAGTTGQFLTISGGVPAWTSYTASIGITDDTASAAAYYPLWAKVTSGSITTEYVSSTKFTFTPSTGQLATTSWSGDHLDMNTGATVTPAVGRMWWDGGTTLNIGMTTNVTGQVGETLFVYIKASATITKGNVVVQDGTVGASGVLKAKPAPLSTTNAVTILGIAAEDIALNGFGLIQTHGYLRGLNTTGSAVGETWADGDLLYYNPAYVGGLTKVKPTAPNIKLPMAEVVTAGTGGSGELFVILGSSSVLGETDSNVQFGTLANNDLIQYNFTLGYWTNVANSSVAVGTATNLAGGGAGYVPYQSAAGTTSFVAAGTSGQVLTSNGTSAPSWTTPTAYATVTDDTTTNADRYPLFANQTAGNLTTEYVSSTKLKYNPSTGTLFSTTFDGAGTGLTGTAASLSIGGNAATASLATKSTNLAGGAAGSLPYQSGADTTTFLAAGTNGQILTLSSGVPTWAAAPSTGITITDDTTTNGTRYIAFTDVTTGSVTGEYVSSTKLQYNPSTGQISSPIVATPLLSITGSSSGYVRFQGAAAAGSTTYTLPSSDGTTGQVLSTNGSGTLSWSSAGGSVTISNDTSTATDVYPAFLAATSGSASTIYTGNAKLLYKPSTGELKSLAPVATNGIVVNGTSAASNYTIASSTNGMSVGPITVSSGVSITVTSGQRWVVI